VSEDPYNAVITWIAPPEIPVEGPLAGRRLIVKDLIDTKGVRTTYGSQIFREHVPTCTAPAVERLLAAGASLIGKANLHEFAWGVTSQNPWYGTVKNPAHPGRTAGGSSGGNAAALAAGMCDLGLGTDTGCSVRLPAACCGIVGLKTSWGSIPTDGVFSLCPSLDTVGPMARSVAEVADAWAALSGRPVPEPRLEGLTIGLLRQAPGVGDGKSEPGSDLAEGYVEQLHRLGARVVEARIPDPVADTWPIFFHEAAESHVGLFPERADEYGDNVRAKLEMAQHVDPARVAIARDALAAWRRYEPEVDLYVSPCVAIDLPEEDCNELDVRIGLAAFLRWVNLIGWAGLAIGNLQLVAPRDEVVLAAGLAWERGD
jgi:aspartyl-tRNA(Asn)/glutamyl-tRNA(Gln) amidotransferase subunit A